MSAPADTAATATPQDADAEAAEFDAAWDEFFAAIRRARGRAVAEVEAEGISLAQFQLLYPFADRGRRDSLPIGELAEAAGVAPPTASRMIDALERAGMVERRHSSAVRRKVVVSPTAKGRKTLNRKRKLVAARRRAVYEALPPEDRARTADLLRRIAAVIQEEW